MDPKSQQQTADDEESQRNLAAQQALAAQSNPNPQEDQTTEFFVEGGGAREQVEPQTSGPPTSENVESEGDSSSGDHNTVDDGNFDPMAMLEASIQASMRESEERMFASIRESEVRMFASIRESEVRTLTTIKEGFDMHKLKIAANQDETANLMETRIESVMDGINVLVDKQSALDAKQDDLNTRMERFEASSVMPANNVMHQGSSALGGRTQSNDPPTNTGGSGVGRRAVTDNDLSAVNALHEFRQDMVGQQSAANTSRNQETSTVNSDERSSALFDGTYSEEEEREYMTNPMHRTLFQGQGQGPLQHQDLYPIRTSTGNNVAGGLPRHPPTTKEIMARAAVDFFANLSTALPASQYTSSTRP